MNTKYKLGIYFGILLVLALFIASDARALISSRSSYGGSYSYSSVQAYQPTIYNSYSSAEISQYWPIIGKNDAQQCVGRQDFIIQIPPGGCTPMVVRSDLLEEQNVPVFCKLNAIKLNPLIDVSAIDRINPTLIGNYPDEIAGIGYHPARAALRSYDRLLGSPLINDIGYIVVVLKQNPVEKNMPKWIEANLSAYLQYDLTNSWGVGRAEYYLPIIDDSLWQRDYQEYGFWRGKGYLRTEWIEGDRAQVSVYLDSGKKIATRVLEKGRISDDIYLPGFYCLAGMQLKLEDLDVPKTSAKLQVNDDILEVRKGSKFADNCYVNNIESYGGGTGAITLTCGQRATLSLDFSEVEFSITESNNVEKKSFKMQDKIIDGNQKYYLVYSAELPSSVNFNGDRRFVVLLNTTESSSFVSARYSEIKKKLNEYMKSIENNERAIDIKDFKLGLPKNYGNLVLLFAGEKIEAGGKEIELSGFDFYDREYADKQGKEGDKLEEYYSSAVESYKELATQFPSEKLETGESYGERALADAAKLSGEIEKTMKQRELLQELIEKYPDSKNAWDAQNELENSAVFKTENSQHIFTKNLGSVNVRLISISEPSKEDANVKIFYTGYDSSGEKANSKQMTLMESDYIYRNNTDYIKLKKINTDSIVVDYSCVSKNEKGGGRRVSNSNLKIYERGNQESSIASFCDFSIEVDSISLKQVAKVIVIPKTIGAQSAVNFSFKIGIEKRAIKLSTEKTQEMIDNLNKTIESWENINKKLGKAVEGLKGACFATSAILNIKNLISNFEGAGTARSMIMRGEGGWMAACESAVSSGQLKVGDSPPESVSYVSVDDCLRDNNDKIESSVSYLADKIKAQNEEIKKMQGDITTKNIFGDSNVDSSKLADRQLNKLKSAYGTSEVPVGTGENKIKVGEVISRVNENNKNLLSIQDMRDIEFNMGIINSGNAPADVQARAKSQLYSTLNNVKTQIDITDPQGLNEQTGHIFEMYQDKDSFNALYRGEVANAKDADLGIPANTPTAAISYNNKNYVVSLKKIKENNYQPVSFTEINSNGGKVNTYDANSSEIENISRKFSKFTKVDENSYKNPFKVRPKVKYWESGAYKGIPAFVPVDVQDGWYAATKQTIGSFGNLKTADASGRITSFWLCNIGTNRLAEFESGIGDDICQMINLETGQPLDLFPGLSREKASALVSKAVKVLQEAASKYQSGIKSVSLSSGTFEVGEPASGQLGTQCQDFMSPQDCLILFNVCDPVICPSSRCNLGGAYPVDDVVQSGIVGSIALCLPNIKEGIIIPVCLTGIHAGLEGYLSILKAHRDCLQESLKSGEHVGICDEIYSIYLCEFFWRQIGPFLNMLIPKMIEMAYGQGARGGGEYLTVMDSWDNMEKSIDYFTGYYANNAVKSFQIKSTQDVGGEVCKAFISTASPNSLKLLLEPESPVQFSAWFSETSYTTATVPATSQYKVFYHIYAGEDQGSYFSVYLKEPPGTSYYQSNPVIVVATGFIPRGEYADETKDFTAPAGYQQLCVRVNNQDECGFKQVSTDFALNYVKEKYAAEQATERITSEKTCISGSASAYPLLNPNIQAGAEEAAMPSIYNRGVIRICSTDNPGSTTEPGRWKDVGYCDEQKVKCWLDQNSVENVIKNKNILNQTISEINNMNSENLFGMNYQEKIDETGSLISNFYEIKIPEFKKKYDSLAQDKLGDMDSEINNLVNGKDVLSDGSHSREIGIDEAISGAVMNSQKAKLLFMKASIYDFATLRVYELIPKSAIGTVPSVNSEIIGGIECPKENVLYSDNLDDGSHIRDTKGNYWVKSSGEWHSDSDNVAINFDNLIKPVCYVPSGATPDETATETQKETETQEETAEETQTEETTTEILEKSPDLKTTTCLSRRYKVLKWTAVDKSNNPKQYSVKVCLVPSLINNYNSKFGEISNKTCGGSGFKKIIQKPYWAFISESSADKYIEDVAQQLKKLAINEFPNDEQGQKQFIGLFVKSAIQYTCDTAQYSCEERASHPYELLYSGKGDCEDSALLLSKLFKIYSFDSALLLWKSNDERHINNAIRCDSCKVDGRKIGSRYVFDVTAFYNAKDYIDKSRLWDFDPAIKKFDSNPDVIEFSKKPYLAVSIDKGKEFVLSQNKGEASISQFKLYNYGDAPATNVKYSLKADGNVVGSGDISTISPDRYIDINIKFEYPSNNNNNIDVYFESDELEEAVYLKFR